MSAIHQDKRAAILSAAERLFAESGYAGTRTADIAREAQVTQRTLFKYFPDKQSLLHHVAYPALDAAAALPQAGEASFAEWFEALLRERLDAARAHPHALRVVLVELLTNPAARKYFGPLWKRHLWSAMVKAIGRFQARGELRRDIDADCLARMVMSLSLGYLLTRTQVAPGLAWDDDKEIARLLEMIQRGATSAGQV